MLDFVKTFGLAIVMFVVMGYATLSYACGGDDVVHPDTAPTPTVEIRL